MNRLTYKLDEPVKTKYLNYEYNRIKDHDIMRGNFGRITDDMIFNKLGKLEDIEEDYGIDLITIFNIYNKLNNQKSIYTKLCSEIKEHHLYGCYFVIDFNEMAFRELDYDSDCLYFKHYGITWALTRKELENE